MILPEDQSKLQALIKRTNHLWKFLECDEKKKKIAIKEWAVESAKRDEARVKRGIFEIPEFEVDESNAVVSRAHEKYA